MKKDMSLKIHDSFRHVHFYKSAINQHYSFQRYVQSTKLGIQRNLLVAASFKLFFQGVFKDQRIMQVDLWIAEDFHDLSGASTSLIKPICFPHWRNRAHFDRFSKQFG